MFKLCLRLICCGLMVLIFVGNLAHAQTEEIVFSEDFEGGILDSRILINPVAYGGSFTSSPKIQAVTNFGSSQAFGFGRSSCQGYCWENFATLFSIRFIYSHICHIPLF